MILAEPEADRALHERGYTVRIPDVVGLTPQLQRFVRPLETVLRQPVKGSVFWGAAEATIGERSSSPR